MPCHDICDIDDRSQEVLVDDVGFNGSDDDADSDYRSCMSYDNDGSPKDDYSDDDEIDICPEPAFGIPQSLLDDWKWEPIRPSIMMNLSDSEIPTKGWIPIKEWNQLGIPVVDRFERLRDAIAVREDTLGREYHPYRIISSATESFWLADVQLLLMFRSGTQSYPSDRVWLHSERRYSWRLRAFEECMVLELSHSNVREDVEDTMRVTLPYFLEAKARFEALSKFHNIDYSSDSKSLFGPANIANFIACLDIAESVAKLVPILGDVLEGACGVLRKILQATEVARAARDECKALAEHTACITLAILNEIGSSSNRCAIPTANIFELCATIGEVERRVTKLSKLGRVKYFALRGKIAAEVTELRTRVDNARIVFKIRNDISTIGLLYDLRAMQMQLASRVEDIVEGQRVTHSKLDMILVQVGNNRGGGSYTAEE